MPSGFRFHALRLLKSVFVDDGGHAIRNANILPDINASISFIGYNAEKGHDLPALASGCGYALRIEKGADPDGRPAGTIKIKDVADNGSLIRLDGIAAIRSAGITKDAGSVVKAFHGIVCHAAGDILGQLAGIPFCSCFQHAFQQYASRAFRDGFHSIKDADTIAAQLAFINCAVFSVSAESVNFPGKDCVKGSGLGSGHHGLKSSAGGNILKTGLCVIGILMNNGITFTLGEKANIRQLLLYGHITLTGGRITGISNSRPGRAGRQFLFLHRITLIETKIRLANIGSKNSCATETDIPAISQKQINGMEILRITPCAVSILL